MAGIIFLMHSESNTGYAIEKLEKIFYRASIDAGFDRDEVFFAYPSIKRGRPEWMPHDNNNFACFNYRKFSTGDARVFKKYLEDNSVKFVFAFDLQPSNSVNPLLRSAGVQRSLSYWGAPMGSMSRPLKLVLKKLEVMLRRSGPDYYIFESEAMRELAIGGRGIPKKKTIIIPTGVDIGRFKPGCASQDFARECYNIPENRKIFCYSGHMEERKGVHVIVKAMESLVLGHQRKDIHFLALGNKHGEEKRFYDMAPKEVFKYITFGGYRDDIEEIFDSSYAGIIASSGWDSWPMSVIEMGASGLPLIVSRLQGLLEFVDDDENGYGFEPGNSMQLSEKMALLADCPEKASMMGVNNRKKVVDLYSDVAQQTKLADVIASRLVLSI